MGPLRVDPPFIFYGQAMSEIYIHFNGLVSFSACSYCGTVIDFTNPTLVPLVAPLWHEATNFNGDVFYRIATDIVTLQSSAAYIFEEFEVLFNPSYVVVVTWVNVPGDSAGNSTFQLLLGSNGVESYMIFAYEDVQVTDHSILAGYSFGDGLSYDILVQGQGSPNVLTSTSNVFRDQTLGRFLFRTDSE